MRKMRTWIFVGLLLLLVACSGERRETRQYLDHVHQSVRPAIEQGKVVEELGRQVHAGEFQASWPVLKKNLGELRDKLSVAQKDMQVVKVPQTATNLHPLITEELTVLSELCQKADVVGEEVAHLPKGLPGLRQLGRLKPQLDELKGLQLRHVELSTKIRSGLDELERRK